MFLLYRHDTLPFEVRFQLASAKTDYVFDFILKVLNIMNCKHLLNSRILNFHFVKSILKVRNA